MSRDNARLAFEDSFVAHIDRNIHNNFSSNLKIFTDKEHYRFEKDHGVLKYSIPDFTLIEKYPSILGAAKDTQIKDYLDLHKL
uniref:HNH endonuclease n=1 Tax=Rhabditophanes sp. KR3021 TaxID=114890 RepID=A0AC35U4H1_9BILA